jgi:hypothetical protein
VWATYPAGLDFIINETTGVGYFQDGTSQEEYADSNLTVLRGGFGYDMTTAFASRIANAGGTEFLSTSPADATGILADPVIASVIPVVSVVASLPSPSFAGSSLAGSVF